MNLSSLYEEILAGNRVTVASSPESVILMYSQLRTIKSRYDKKYQSLTGERISEGKVIRYEFDSSKSNATFYLGEKVKASKIEFTIVSITDSINECPDNMNKSGET